MRLVSEVPGRELDNLPALQGDSEIATNIRLASKSVYHIRQEKRSTIPGQLGTKAQDNLVRQHCKPMQYSNKLLKHLATLWELIS